MKDINFLKDRRKTIRVFDCARANLYRAKKSARKIMGVDGRFDRFNCVYASLYLSFDGKKAAVQILSIYLLTKLKRCRGIDLNRQGKGKRGIHIFYNARCENPDL